MLSFVVVMFCQKLVPTDQFPENVDASGEQFMRTTLSHCSHIDFEIEV